MIIGVVDGQGGGIGSRIVKRLKEKLPEGWEILALGTNASATAAMIAAGAESGATGEGALVWNSLRCAALCGPVGIVLANAMMGELTPRMAEAVASSPAEKFLVPVSACGVQMAGQTDAKIPELVDDLAERLLAWVKDPREGLL
ncbi:MAG: DUF3842 family protein [Planctomycetota bacterium]